MSGPPAGVSTSGGPPSAAQIATMKEAGVKASFVDDMGMNMGSYVMGYVTDLILLGVLLAQVWHWYTWTKGERNFIRVIIYWVLFWCTFSSIFTMLWFNNLLVDNYGTYSQFVDNSWFQWLPFIGEGILLACQIFNLERAYRLHHRKIWVLLAIIPLMLAAAAGVLGIKIKTGGGTDFTRGSYAIRPFMYLYLGGTLAVDIVITGIIAWGLWKSKTGWRHTDKMIMRIIMFSWESQVLPTLFAIVQLATFAHQPDDRIAFYFMISYAKVPAVSLMAVLNFRFSLRKDLTGANITNGLAGIDQAKYDPRDGGDHDQGFHAIRDDIPMVKYDPHANPTDWQPPQEK